MKNLSAKNILLTLAQVPVVLMLSVVAYIELSLTKLLGYLANPFLSPKPQAILKRIVDSRPLADTYEEYRPTNTIYTNKGIEDILFVFDKRNNYQLNGDRKVFENTEAGQRVKAGHPNRHLYAVLCPTRSENLKRIKNVLQAMSPAELRRIHNNAERHKRFLYC